MYIILVYDIAVTEENGQKRLRKVFNLCKKHLHHVQCSVFEGEVTESELEKIKLSINKLISHEKDSIIIFKSNSQKWLGREMIGLQEDKTDNFI